MEIKVIAFYEDHWMPPGTDHAQWDHLCRAYNTDLQMVRSWEEAEVPEGSWVVLLDEQGILDLSTIGDLDNSIKNMPDGQLPPHTTLVFGRTAMDLMTYLPEGSWDYAFVIKTPMSIPMFGVNACSIALFAFDQWKRAQEVN